MSLKYRLFKEKQNHCGLSGAFSVLCFWMPTCPFGLLFKYHFVLFVICIDIKIVAPPRYLYGPTLKWGTTGLLQVHMRPCKSLWTRCSCSLLRSLDKTNSSTDQAMFKPVSHEGEGNFCRCVVSHEIAVWVDKCVFYTQYLCVYQPADISGSARLCWNCRVKLAWTTESHDSVRKSWVSGLLQHVGYLLNHYGDLKTL